MDFAPVPLVKALGEADSFYSRYNQIKPENRKLLLVRIPTDVPVASLDGLKISKKEIKGEFLTDSSTKYTISKCQEASPVALALPASDGFSLETNFDEFWTVTRTMVSTDPSNVGAEFDYTRDYGGQGQPRLQPEGLGDNLSPIDFNSVLKRGSRRLGRKSKIENDDVMEKLASPKTKKKKNVQ